MSTTNSSLPCEVCDAQFLPGEDFDSCLGHHVHFGCLPTFSMPDHFTIPVPLDFYDQLTGELASFRALMHIPTALEARIEATEQKRLERVRVKRIVADTIARCNGAERMAA